MVLRRDVNRAIDEVLHRVIPSVMTDWRSWKAQYPRTDVLDMSRTTEAFVTDLQKEPGAYTLGFRMDGEIVDFPFDVLKTQYVINARTEKTPYLVTFDVDSATPRVFARAVSGKTLTFSLKQASLQGRHLIDSETNSIWNPVTGECTSGELNGKQLKMLACTPSFIRAWKSFYPKSATYSLDSSDKE